MLVVDEPKLSATICAAILKVAHKNSPLPWRWERVSHVALIPKRDLLPCAKHLFVGAMVVALLPEAQRRAFAEPIGKHACRRIGRPHAGAERDDHVNGARGPGVSARGLRHQAEGCTRQQ